MAYASMGWWGGSGLVVQYLMETCIISRLSHPYITYGQFNILQTYFCSLCEGNERLVVSTHRAQPSPWRNDSHCKCLCLEGGGFVVSVCVDNERLVVSTHRAHPSLWRNDSHCVCSMFV